MAYKSETSIKTRNNSNLPLFLRQTCPGKKKWQLNNLHDHNLKITFTSMKDVDETIVSNGETENISTLYQPKREKWSNKIDFLLACIGFSVGLGNVWRFPYLCYKNGGGAFLIPYFISVFLGGIPIFFLEVSLGQFMSRGGIEAWNICPLFKGIGVASIVVVACLNIYYNVILAWAIYYLFASINTSVPWSHCTNSYNTERCTMNITLLNNSNVGNITRKFVDPVTEFWEEKVLAISDSIQEVGIVKWDNALCLLLAWIIVYFCIWKGIKTSGKVMYVTATSPYIFMFILLIRSATLEGAMNGIKFYLIPDFSRLTHFQVWVDAGTQIFFSYSLSIGTLTALGSFNKFHHNSFKDCILFSAINSGTSFFAGFVIFMTLGYMSHVSGIPIENVATQGPGLAFIAYPKALAEMPFPVLWSVTFFFMILLLGLDSQFVGVEGFITAISDLFPRWMHRGYNKQIFIAGICCVSYLIGLTMVTNGGMYVFQLFDYFTGSRIVLLIACLECFVICFVYGIRRYSDNLRLMYGFPFGNLPMIMWCFVTPAFTMIIFIMSTVTYSSLTYERSSHIKEYVFPTWSIALGWCMAASSILMVPLVMIIKIFQEKGTLRERIVTLIRPQIFLHQSRVGIDDPREIIEDKMGGKQNLRIANVEEIEETKELGELSMLEEKFSAS